ncbi:hypothetical protein [Isoptericola sp. BMS4]|uniref:hypothetical protein n=1 Tax=Isoptericola sp. BMS4 TaxID=2527875 RepID=UPI0014216873|nr:hypothetical protein [Isoptericola sp. BMS4]
MTHRTNDEDFARELRAHIDTVGPEIAVDLDAVVPRARRRRVRRVVVTGLASVGVVALAATWAVSAEPWVRPAQVQPAGPVMATDDSEKAEEPAPHVSVAPGWPEGKYWYVESNHQERGDDTVAFEQSWSGHDDPGLHIQNQNVDDAWAKGPSAWGSLKIDGEWVLIGWDELYELPTSAPRLREILFDSVRPDRGAGTPEDKVFEMAAELLRESPAPPALRDAVWQVMSELSVTTLEVGSDSTGRPGEVLDHVVDGRTGERYVYDVVERRLLEQWYFDTEGEWVGRETYVTERTAGDTPIEPTLEMAGCARWENC